MNTKVVFAIAAAAVLTLASTISLSSAKDTNSGVVVLSESNTIVLNTQVDGESTGKVISEAKSLDAKLRGVRESFGKKAPIYIFLNTPGGSIQAGLEMIEALKGIGRPVHTITLFAASMGFQIAQNLDNRYIIKNGVLMSHRAKGGFEGEFGGQAPSQIDSRYALWKSRLDELDNQTVSRTKNKQTLASYQKQYASEMWLTGTQSVDQGYADEVIAVKCDSSLAGTEAHDILFLGAIPVHYELDKCPINTSPLNIRVGFVTNTKGYMNEAEFLAAGGQFGADCLVQSATDKTKLCALDTSMNLRKIRELAEQFKSQFESKKNTVVDAF